MANEGGVEGVTNTMVNGGVEAEKAVNKDDGKGNGKGKEREREKDRKRLLSMSLKMMMD